VAIEHYLVRAAELGAPDLRWVAYVDFDPEARRGTIRWQGGLEGKIDDFEGDRAGLEQQFATWRDVDGYQVDRI
jgi:hypothetical protein